MRTHALMLISATLLGSMVASGCGGGGGSPSSLDALLMTGAVVGNKGKLRVSFSNPVERDATVNLRAETPDLIGLPAEVVVKAGALSADFDYDGLALGAVSIRATHAGVERTVSASVVARFEVQGVGGVTLETGAAAPVSVFLNAAPPEPIEVTLASGDPTVAKLPAALTISPFLQYGYTYVNAIAPGSAQVTAKIGPEDRHGVVRVVDHARLANLYLQPIVETGATVIVQVRTDAIAAKAKTLALLFSDPSIVTAPSSITIPEGADYQQFEMKVGAPGATTLTLSLDDSSLAASITSQASARLSNFGLSEGSQVGLTSQLNVQLDVQSAVPHQVSLSSSDPTIIAVPGQVRFEAGDQYRSLPLSPLKAGTVILTATLDGVSLQTYTRVAMQPSLQLSGSTNLALGARTNLYLGLSGGSGTATPVKLTSSDATVVSLPSSVSVQYGQSIPVTALKVGTAQITATALGQTQVLQMNVVDHAVISYGQPSYSVNVAEATVVGLSLSAVPPSGTIATFTSSAPTIVPAPESVLIPEGGTYLQFPIRGVATGTAIVTVTIGVATYSMVVYVGASSSSYATLSGVYPSGTKLQVGASTYVQVSLSSAVTIDTPVGITFSIPGIVSTVGAQVVVPSGRNYAYFPVSAIAAGTTDVMATLGGIVSSSTLQVVTTPTFTITVPSSVKVGKTLAGTLSSDTALAANTTFSLASLNGATATVTNPTITLGPGVSSTSVDFGVIGIAVGSTSIVATLGVATQSAPVTVAP